MKRDGWAAECDGGCGCGDVGEEPEDNGPELGWLGGEAGAVCGSGFGDGVCACIKQLQVRGKVEKGRRDGPKRWSAFLLTLHSKVHPPNDAVLFHTPASSCTMFTGPSGPKQFGVLSTMVVFTVIVPLAMSGSYVIESGC